MLQHFIPFFMQVKKERKIEFVAPGLCLNTHLDRQKGDGGKGLRNCSHHD